MADPRIEVRGGATIFEAMGLRAALGCPVGHGQSPGVGPGGGARELLNFRNFIGLKTCLSRSHFYHISVILNGGKIDRMTQNLQFFGLKYKFSLKK
jgi:hypothetical protein